jgi:para-aminobenzoate synthetase/4-amino-4-deoxychorismate lyase
MLVIAGRAVELDAHLMRLSASVETLYGHPLPERARGLVLDRAGELECGKLRLSVAPAPGAARLAVDAQEIDPGAVFPGAGRGAALRSSVVAGGLGKHKWADRNLLDRLADAFAGELPLLLDADGAVLEASRGSVFLVIEGRRLLTPPSDGRILPSIARRQTIEVANAEGIVTGEERLTLDDLLAGEVFLTGSVRGIEPVTMLDGADLAPQGELSARIGAGLRSRWRAPAGEPVAAGAGGRPGDPRGR